MRTIFERAPVTAPFDREAEILGGRLHYRCKTTVKRPVPADLTIKKDSQINGMTSKMARVHGLARACLDKLRLPLRRAEPLSYLELDRAYFVGTFDDLPEIRVNPRELGERHGQEVP